MLCREATCLGACHKAHPAPAQPACGTAAGTPPTTTAGSPAQSAQDKHNTYTWMHVQPSPLSFVCSQHAKKPPTTSVFRQELNNRTIKRLEDT